MRWDEHGWDNYGPPFLHDIRGGVDAQGNIVAIEDTQFGVPAARIDPPELWIGLTQKSDRRHVRDGRATATRRTAARSTT